MGTKHIRLHRRDRRCSGVVAAVFWGVNVEVVFVVICELRKG
jgi:hypothetical protein